jgi:hypothetical protein
MKTSELIGAQLDWAVAKCEELLSQPDIRIGYEDISFTFQGERVYWRPSENWAQGGHIIEREKITVAFTDRAKRELITSAEGLEWEADIAQDATEYLYWSEAGPTPLIAAMRCYVASKLGDEVEIPEELK